MEVSRARSQYRELIWGNYLEPDTSTVAPFVTKFYHPDIILLDDVLDSGVQTG